MHRARLLFISCCLIAWVAGSAVAADESLPEVLVTAPEERPPAPTSFQEQLQPADDARALTTVPEVLSRAVGVHVRSTGSIGQFATMSIRGSSAEQVAVFLDGARLNGNGTGVADLSLLPIDLVESIDVIRGGGTAQFGPNAVGGVVRLSSAPLPEGRRAAVALRGGSFLTLQASASAAQRQGHHRFLASVSHESSRGDFSFQPAATTLSGTVIGGGATQRRTHNRTLQEGLLTKYEYVDGEQTRVRLTNLFGVADRQLPGLEMETTQLAPLNPLEATQRLYRDAATISAEWTDVGAEGHALQAGLHHLFEWSRFSDPSPALGPAIARRSITDTINPFVEWRYDRATTRGAHALTARYDYQFDLFDDAARNTTTTALGHVDRDLHTVLVQDEWQVVTDRLWLVPVGRIGLAPTVDRFAEGKFGVIGRPVSWLSLQGNIETAHRLPSFYELYHPDQGFIRGNPDLTPERAWHWDAGVRVDHPVVAAEVAYFQQHIRNSILFVPISATTIAPINTLAVRGDGVEARVRVTPHPIVELRGNYTWLRSRFRGTGQQLPGRPEHEAALRLEVRPPLGDRWDLRLYGEGQWVAATPFNLDNSVWIAARTTIDTGLKGVWRTSHGAEYSLGVEAANLTNVQRYDSKGFPLPRRAFFVSLGGKWGA